MARKVHIKIAFIKAAIVLVPSYTAAYLTGDMVWVVPMLAASSFFAASIGLPTSQLTRLVDEENEEENEVEAVLETTDDTFADFDG